MITISIELTDEEAAELQQWASSVSMSLEQLAAAVLRDGLSDHDDEREQPVNKRVEASAALYSRLF
jgi:hypothetical protein